MGISKIIEAHEEGPHYYEDRWEEHTDWWNGSYVALSDCGEIWNLQEDEQYWELSGSLRQELLMADITMKKWLTFA